MTSHPGKTECVRSKKDHGPKRRSVARRVAAAAGTQECSGTPRWANASASASTDSAGACDTSRGQPARGADPWDCNEGVKLADGNNQEGGDDDDGGGGGGGGGEKEKRRATAAAKAATPPPGTSPALPVPEPAQLVPLVMSCARLALSCAARRRSRLDQRSDA